MKGLDAYSVAQNEYFLVLKFQNDGAIVVPQLAKALFR